MENDDVDFKRLNREASQEKMNCGIWWYILDGRLLNMLLFYSLV